MLIRHRPTLQLILDLPQLAVAEGKLLAFQSRPRNSTGGGTTGNKNGRNCSLQPVVQRDRDGGAVDEVCG